ncbi:MAG TPA: adenosylmethionine--8-amino-7-oxononanoate transaminase [Anaeromyxobacter sp.]|nr:adenosylmethionine--8-amino-7-oxononanoate transaminase [Anaeromyxobacter sp.]
MTTHWQRRDLAHVWHPCSQMKDYEDFPPIVVERGEGAWLVAEDGTRYLDAVSSWWTNLHGHGNARIAAAIARQAAALEHVIFANFTHKPAIRLAEELCALLPPGLARVFFADNGSAAVEVALKMSFQHHQQQGQVRRRRFASLAGAYHGETLGALATGDLDLYSAVFRPLMMDTLRVPGPDCYRCPVGKTRDTCAAECFGPMEQALEEHGDTLCAVIVEPLVQCAAGMRIYPPVYLRRLREATARRGVHLVADEIAVGFGRTGRMFALEHAGIVPDLVCLSKGITGGFLPLSAVVTNEEIYRSFYADYVELKAFMHSHSYTGNPIACAAALENLAIFREEGVLARVAARGATLARLAREAFAGLDFVGEYRQLGLVGAVELVEDRAARRGFDWRLRAGYRAYRRALARGVLLRPLGNVLYFMPPYCVTDAELGRMVEVARDCAIETVDALRAGAL